MGSEKQAPLRHHLPPHQIVFFSQKLSELEMHLQGPGGWKAVGHDIFGPALVTSTIGPTVQDIMDTFQGIMKSYPGIDRIALHIGSSDTQKQ